MTAAHIAAATGDMLSLTSILQAVTPSNGAADDLAYAARAAMQQPRNLWDQSPLDLLKLKHRLTAGVLELQEFLGQVEALAARQSKHKEAVAPKSEEARGSEPEQVPVPKLVPAPKPPDTDAMAPAQRGWDVREEVFEWGPLQRWNESAGQHDVPAIHFSSLSSVDSTQKVHSTDLALCLSCGGSALYRQCHPWSRRPRFDAERHRARLHGKGHHSQAYMHVVWVAHVNAVRGSPAFDNAVLATVSVGSRSSAPVAGCYEH